MINLVLKKQCIDVNSQYMKIEKVLKQAFGINEYELIDFPKKIPAYRSRDCCMEIKWDVHIAFHMASKRLIPVRKNTRETGKNIERLILKWKAGAVKQKYFVGGSNTGSNPVLETDGVMVSLCHKFLFELNALLKNNQVSF